MKYWFAAFAVLIIEQTNCFATHTPVNQHLKSDEYYMKIAIRLAHDNPKAPFAALIVDNKTGKILATGLNASKKNPTYHGEMVAINHCIETYPHIDWSKVTLYTTAEPCAMCQSAVVWANISRVVFATSVKYLASHGWNQIDMPAASINTKASFYKGSLTGGVMAREANRLFDKKTSMNKIPSH